MHPEELQELKWSFKKAGREFKKATHHAGKAVSNVAHVMPQVYQAAKPYVQQVGKAWKEADPNTYNQYAKPLNQGIKSINAAGNKVGGWEGIDKAGQKMQKAILVQLI